MKIEQLAGSEESKILVDKFLAEWENDKDYVLQQTSGSTGKPKVLKVKKEHMMASARTTNSFFKLTENSSYLLCISPSFIGGKMIILRALLSGGTLVIGPVNSTPIEHLNRTIDFAAMVPLQVENCIKHDNFGLIKTLIIGGAPVNENLAKALIAHPVLSYSTFGMTETVSHIALKFLGKADQAFEVLPPTTVDCNANGQLIIQAPHLGIEQMLTNDIVELHSPTRFTWKGRADFTINSGGIKLQPEEIEKKIVTFLPNRTYMICGLAHPTLGEQITLCVEGEILDVNDLKASLKTCLGKYEMPKEFYTLNSFTYTANGKLNRLQTCERIKLEGTLQ